MAASTTQGKGPGSATNGKSLIGQSIDNIHKVLIDDNGDLISFAYFDENNRLITRAVSNTQTVPSHDALDIIGKGIGSTKTITAIVGDATLVEVFGIGDEIYVHWLVPCNIVETEDIRVEIHWIPTGSESGKLASWELTVLPAKNGVNLGSASTTVIDLEDISLGDTANVIQITELNLSDSIFVSSPEDVHFKLKRVASSNDPASNVAVDHIDLHYTSNLICSEV
jgi:hypothetical protein